MIKAIAAQTREKRFYEGTEIVASNVGFAKGLQKFEDLANKTVAIDEQEPDISLSARADREHQKIRHQKCHREADAVA